jgi:signal transduction histidine kinase/CheY-like chemotaxis protein/predicted RNA-binding protein with RPS1 domain
VTSEQQNPRAANRIVTGVVESVFPFGVFVRLPDGSQGYIRRRELSLSGDVEPAAVTKEGDEIQAVVVEPARSERSAELSVRLNLPNPWVAFVHTHKVGDSLRGVVKEILPHGVWIEAALGVRGWIPAGELTTQSAAKPEAELWPGDVVEGTIMHLDGPAERLRLSIRLRAQRLASVDAYMKQLKLSSDEASANDAANAGEQDQSAPPGATVACEGLILVVEDDVHLREPLVALLRNWGCQAEGLPDAREAVVFLQRRPCTAVIADLDMPGLDGVGFIRQLRRNGNDVPVAVMSLPEIIARNYTILRALEVNAVLPKPLNTDDVQRFLTQAAAGERPLLPDEIDSKRLRESLKADTGPQPASAEAQSLAATVVERFRADLGQLVEQMRADLGVVFRLDPASRQVSVLASSGALPMKMDNLYLLLGSPVRDVIEEGITVSTGRVSQDGSGRFRKLTEVLTFESCLGVPLTAAGRTEHALFIFSREMNAFSQFRVPLVLATAALFGSVLEREALQRQVRSVSGLLASGQLIVSFRHEVANLVSGLDLKLGLVDPKLALLGKECPDLAGNVTFQEITAAFNAVQTDVEDLKRLTESFRRLMETRVAEAFDAGQVIRDATQQMRPMARKATAEIQLKLAANASLAVGSDVSLYQILVNLMLNAVQHMDDPHRLRRILTVSSTLGSAADPLPIKVRCADTGPGIHCRLWDRVFDLGFTTRPQGSGMGLYIARNLAETAGWRLTIEESLMGLGTIFLVELPAVRLEEV